MAHGIELKVCMGSACHQKGVSDVLPILERLIDENGLETVVELKGALRFREEILPAIRSEVDE